MFLSFQSFGLWWSNWIHPHCFSVKQNRCAFICRCKAQTSEHFLPCRETNIIGWTLGLEGQQILIQFERLKFQTWAPRILCIAEIPGIFVILVWASTWTDCFIPREHLQPKKWNFQKVGYSLAKWSFNLEIKTILFGRDVGAFDPLVIMKYEFIWWSRKIFLYISVKDPLLVVSLKSHMVWKHLHGTPNKVLKLVWERISLGLMIVRDSFFLSYFSNI